MRGVAGLLLGAAVPIQGSGSAPVMKLHETGLELLNIFTKIHYIFEIYNVSEKIYKCIPLQKGACGLYFFL